jgi:hypothetical protein
VCGDSVAAGTIVTIEASKIIWRTLARTDSTICTSGFYAGTKCTCLLAYMKTAVLLVSAPACRRDYLSVAHCLWRQQRKSSRVAASQNFEILFIGAGV